MNALAEVFLRVLANSLDATVLALLVGGVLLLVGTRFAPAWRHALWLLVALRLLLPATPESPLSWRHWAAPTLAAFPLAPHGAEPVRAGSQGDQMTGPPAAETADAPDPQTAATATEAGPTEKTLGTHLRAAAPGPDAVGFVALLWGAGAGSYLLALGIASWRFRRMVSRLECRDAALRDRARCRLDALAAELGLSRFPRLIVTDAVAAPALARPLRPEILIPPSALERLDDGQLRHVLLHELAHWRRGDLWANWALCLLQALHWFNPAVWWAFRRTRLAAERAADAWVLRHEGGERPGNYAETLLRLLEAAPPDGRRLPGIVGVMESPRDLRARVEEIARHRRWQSGQAAAAAVVVAALLTAVGLTGAPRAPETLFEAAEPQTDTGDRESLAVANWQIHKLGGREYVSDENVAEFYQFERLEKQGLVRVFRNPALTMTWRLGDQTVYVKNLKFNLSFPVVEHKGMAMLSIVDLAKLVDPVLRPSYIKNPIHFDTVVIDAGHGGHDSGGVGPFGREKDYALDTALRLREGMHERGFKTVMTRDTDVFLTLSQRIAIANAQRDAIFISIHYNSSGSRDAIGIETFSLAPQGTHTTHGGSPLNTLLSGNLRDAENIALATAVHARVIRDLDSVDRGIKRGRFNVLRGIEMPAILFEGGFLSNEYEARLIHDADYRQHLAESIADAVLVFRDDAGTQAP